ncbi:hypothetical protein [Streptomyces sp. MZ04]|uniref:hypothetical protein n=1 Tax=Streptomyces sp. MZ04 TaxID=2559236 RepID=UPI00107E8AF5|nr:hypothetical protein [Streptomyces sp. MZ04]TGA93797.1 hypothetical protein E2651_35485 [Streptomyces sp. MZ04]
MKPLKAAAVVAGSMVIAGAAAPAFAADLTPTSLNGALDTITSQSTLDAAPLATNALDTENPNSVVNSVKGATEDVGSGGNGAPSQLLGGLPLAK